MLYIFLQHFYMNCILITTHVLLKPVRLLNSIQTKLTVNLNLFYTVLNINNIGFNLK